MPRFYRIARDDLALMFIYIALDVSLTLRVFFPLSTFFVNISITSYTTLSLTRICHRPSVQEYEMLHLLEDLTFWRIFLSAFMLTEFYRYFFIRRIPFSKSCSCALFIFYGWLWVSARVHISECNKKLWPSEDWYSSVAPRAQFEWKSAIKHHRNTQYSIWLKTSIFVEQVHICSTVL